MAINKKLIATGGDTSIVASDYFKIKLYTGNYSTSRNITGHNFRPALVWIKNRDQNDPHMIYDSTRGVNKFIAFNSGANEASDTNQLLAFLSNGFRIGDDARVNTSNEDYIAYSFKANSGSTNSNTDGSITSTVQTSVESGFSIIKFFFNAIF